MAEKLPVQTGGLPIGDKLWKIHQQNEYTHVDRYKEALCFMCFKRKASLATVVDVCTDCIEKRGSLEALLALAGFKPYGLCLKCGKYKFELHVLNVRLCQSCFYKIRQIIKAYNKAGGPKGADPFWKSMRKRFGKDYGILMDPGITRKIPR